MTRTRDDVPSDDGLQNGGAPNDVHICDAAQNDVRGVCANLKDYKFLPKQSYLDGGAPSATNGRNVRDLCHHSSRFCFRDHPLKSNG